MQKVRAALLFSFNMIAGMNAVILGLLGFAVVIGLDATKAKGKIDH